MQVTLSQAATMIAKYIRVGLVAMLHGSPGKGKSAIVHEVAKQYNLKVIDLRLSQCDPTDLMGFPNILGSRAGYVPMDTFPIEGDRLPDGYDGWLLFLDEANGAPLAVQAASYKLILDRMIGKYHLHKNVAIVCAGNLETDGAITEPMSTAMQSRLAHIELMDDVEGWLDWAATNGIDNRITSYIGFRPGNLYDFNPEHTDKTYACNRTWEFANRVLKVTADNDPDRLPMLAGVISEGKAREFLTYIKIYTSLPTIGAIVANPEAVHVSNEPSVLYAITGCIAHGGTEANIDQLSKYIKRLPEEFQVICLREMVRRTPALKTNKSILEWAKTISKELF
jgi:hypothetical protein